MTRILALGRGIIKIISDNHPIDITFDISEKIIPLEAEECDLWVSLCEQLSSLYRFVGIAVEPMLTMKSIADEGDKIGSLYSLLHPETETVSQSFSLSVEQAEASVPPLNFEVICADVLELGDLTIGYCALVHMQRAPIEERAEWVSESVNLLGFIVKSCG